MNARTGRQRIHPHLRQVYDAFGPQRMFWGTDITRMPCSWKQCVTQFTEELPWLTGHDLELVMGRAFCDWIGWKLPGTDAMSQQAGSGFVGERIGKFVAASRWDTLPHSVTA